MRRVERERPRLDLADREVAFGTGEPFREQALRALAVRVGDKRETLAETQRGLDRVREPRALGLRLGATADDEPVDHDLDRVLLHLVESDVFGEIADEAVHTNARETAAAGGREELLVLAFAVADERPEHQDARPFRHCADLIDDLLDRLRDDRDPVVRAMRHTDPREEKTQVVVDLRDGSDG